MPMLSSYVLSLALYGAANALEHRVISQTKFPVNPLCLPIDPFPSLCYRASGHEISIDTSLPLTINPQPWTFEPICTNKINASEKFCTFTSGTLYNNRGITIFTKPQIANLIAKQPAFMTSQNYTPSTLSEHDIRDLPYEIRDLPGRGKGVIATRRVEPGELLFAHPAIAILNDQAVDTHHPSYHTDHFHLMKQSINQLPSSTVAKFHSMAAHHSGDPYISRINTNTFGELFGGEEHSIVVPETARLNHDCRPNAMYYFDPRTLIHYTHAARSILPGEEITITYVDPLQTRLKRRKALNHTWGFECTCSLCSQSQMFVRESNRRIVKILELSGVFEGTSKRENRVAGNARMAELLVSLYEQERLYSTASEGYRFAALSYSAIGQKWEALKWAMKAVEMGLVHSGPREGNVRDMMSLLDGVEEHWSWGVNLERNITLETENS